MNKHARLLPLLASLGLLLGQGAFAADGDVLAIVNGKKITEAEYNRYVKHGEGRSQAANREAALQEIINIELINADATKKKYDKDAEFVAALNDFKRTQLAAYTVRKVVTDGAAPTESEINAEYQRLIADMPKYEYKAHHILVDSADAAKEIITTLAAGAKFETVAREKSLDDAAQEGGDLGWFTVDQMEPDFAAAVTGLNAGEYTKTPVQTSYGFHIIQLDERRDLTAAPLEQVRDQVRASLLKNRFTDYLASLRTKAKIEIK